MPPRPAPIIGRKPHAGSSTANNRLSAVYIGSNPSITNSPLSASHFTVLSSPPVDIAEETIPDLPEPPSPEGSFESDFSGDSGSPERRRGTIGRNNSGLPSPPATNSTGSGSTKSKGDDQEEVFEDTKKGKERPVSLASSSGSSSTMSPSMNGRGGSQDSPSLASSSSSPLLHTARRALHRNQSSVSSVTSALERSTRANEDVMLTQTRSPTSLIQEHDRDDEGDNDETAKYDSIRRPPANFTAERRPSHDNSDALSRVKSLTQRNKLVLDKLSSYPRASSSSPRPPSSASRLSHTRSVKSTSSGGSHSRSQSHSQPKASTSRSMDNSDPQNVLSGSETERESVSNRSVSSHARSTISSARRAERDRVEREREERAPSRARPRTPPSPPQRRTRVPSAPESPFTALTSSNTRLNRDRVGIGDHGRDSPGPPLSSHSSPSRRKRVSMATPPRMGFSASTSAADHEDDRSGASPYGEFGERPNMRAQSSLALVTPMADYEERRKFRESQREHRASRDVKDIMQAAMAAVTASRRGNLDQASNSGSGHSGGSAGRTRSRAALPLEFRNSGDPPRMTAEPEPMTPLRAPSLSFSNSNSSSNTTTSHTGSMATNLSGSSSAASYRSRPLSAISSTSLRHQQKRWGSEDYRNGGHPAYPVPPNSAGAGRSPRKDRHSTDYVGMAEYRERRQSLRGGSAESALSSGAYGRSLVGEGLRAAGLHKGSRLSLGGTSRGVPPLSFPAEQDGEESDEERIYERSRRDTIVPSRVGGTPGSRAATSLGNYHHTVRESEHEEDVVYDRDLDREREQRRTLRSGRASLTPATRERSLARDEDGHMDRAPSALSRYGTLRTSASNAHLVRERESGTASPYGARRQSNMPSTPGGGTHPLPQQEHTKLLVDSLVMFESNMTRLGGVTSDETIRNAHTVVGLAERLNDLLRSNNARCLDEQVKAEVEDAASGGQRRGEEGKEAAEIWGSLGVEFRDGLKLSDELIRTLTSFLLGVGRAAKDIGEPGNHHARSVSLDEEGLRRRGSMTGLGNPDVFAGGGGGSDERKSRESRRSSEQPRESVDAFIASRRMSARAESTLGQVRSTLGSGARHSTPPPVPPSESSSRHSAGASSGSGHAMRRLFTPREQRERDREAQYHHADEHRPGMPTITSQESLRDYEPSPTPVSRGLNPSQATVRSQAMPSVPRPLPTLPSERNSLDMNTESPSARIIDTIRDSNRKRERRTASIIIPSRGPSLSSNGSSFPTSITTPSGATTALTTHTVSNHQNHNTPSPQAADQASFPSLRRGDSDNSSAGKSPAVTFSRPTTVSVSTLNGLVKDGERRKRRGSAGSNGAEPSTSYVPERLKEVMSGSETERPRNANLLRSRTLGPSRSSRASLDGQVAAIRAATGSVNAADRSAAISAGAATTRAGGTRERRRTVTDIWPQT